MRVFFLIIAIVLVQASAMAHNPLTAKFELNQTDEAAAFVNINLSQTGLHQALIKYYADKDMSVIPSKKYKELAVQYLKDRISLKADGRLLVLGEGGIKLGSHQTDLKFLIENYPTKPRTLEVDIDAFKENGNHHSVFWWNQQTGSIKVILAARNNYHSVLDSDAKSNAILSSQFELSPVLSILSILGLTLIVGLYFSKRGQALLGET